MISQVKKKIITTTQDRHVRRKQNQRINQVTLWSQAKWTKLAQYTYTFSHDDESRDSEQVKTEKENTETDSDKPHDAEEPPVTQVRPQRNVKPPAYLTDYHCTVNVDYACAALTMIPETFEQAINSNDAEYWKAAMNAEINMLNENETWEVTTLPPDRTETKGKWVYTIKQGQQDNEVTYKARYVARGFSQVHCIDYDETFSLTTRFATIQNDANEDLHLHQMDVKGAYLNAPIDIYVQQPPGYVRTDKSGKPLTCHLKSHSMVSSKVDEIGTVHLPIF